MQYNLPPSTKNMMKQSKQGISEQTQDQLRPFRISEIIDKQIDVEKMAPDQLIKYCHHQWTEWMKHMLQLQQCIRQQQSQASHKSINRTSQINIAQTKIQDEQNKQPRPRENNKPVQQYRLPGHPMYPPSFMGKDFETVMRSQSSYPIPSNNFMPGPYNPTGMQVKPTQTSSHPQFIQNPSQMKSSFPFPYPHDKPMTSGFPMMGFQSQNYNQNFKRPFPDQQKMQIQKSNDKQTVQKQ